MLRSLYIGTTGMITQRNKMDTITNNIVNVETVGYKKDQMVSRSFGDMLLNRLHDGQTEEVGPLNNGTHIDVVQVDWTQGPMQNTGESTDVCIVGDGFFTVMTPDGVRYTRSGDFNVDVNGDLVTQEGYYVIGTNGGRISPGTSDIEINGTGVASVNGQQVGALQVVQFQNNDNLRKMGDNTYVPYDNEQPAAVAAPSVKQGYLEGSNVDIGREVADMLMTNRVYESNQRIVKMVDQSLELTVNEIGKF